MSKAKTAPDPALLTSPATVAPLGPSTRRLLALLLPAVLLAACGPRPEAEVEPPLPKRPPVQTGAAVRNKGAALAPLATPQQVVRAVDVGRGDPFEAVLTPRLIRVPQGQKGGKRVGLPKPPPPLEPPKGLEFQGVLQGAKGAEALVEYVPSDSKAEGRRSGSLHVGDVGTVRDDSLLPLGWKVRAIDLPRGLLVLQRGQQLVNLQL